MSEAQALSGKRVLLECTSLNAHYTKIKLSNGTNLRFKNGQASVPVEDLPMLKAATDFVTGRKYWGNTFALRGELGEAAEAPRVRVLSNKGPKKVKAARGGKPSRKPAKPATPPPSDSAGA